MRQLKVLTFKMRLLRWSLRLQVRVVNKQAIQWPEIIARVTKVKL